MCDIHQVRSEKRNTMKKSMGAKTILYPTPVLVVGTYDADGRANAMTAAWGGIACSKPPCVSVSLRSATASHGNIMARKAFTISLPSEAYAAHADYFGVASGRDHDKFAELGLTAVRSDLVDAPYVSEFPLVLECAVVGVHELGLHTQFIGEILDVKVDDTALDENGAIDVALLRPILYVMGQGYYHAVGEAVAKAYSAGKALVEGPDKA
jgi:flavin reductase (DIM6/NTAB) family NADH-FMN oxidoreductase RutF